MLIKRASRKGSALGNLSQDVATRSSLWTKFVMTISFDFPLLDLSLGKRNNLSEFYGFSQATIWQVPSSRWLWILIMVQCNMTLRGHNPHDSQHGRLSHVCHCLSCLWGFAWNPQKKSKKGSEGKIQWTSVFSGSSRSTLVSRIEPPPLPSTFIIQVAMMQKVTSK